MYLHVKSQQCYFQEYCRNILCPFRHDNTGSKCSQCGNSYTTERDLIDHKQRIHNNINDNMCENTEDDDKGDSDDEPNYGLDTPCGVCGETFEEVEDLIIHYADTAHNLD